MMPAWMNTPSSPRTSNALRRAQSLKRNQRRSNKASEAKRGLWVDAHPVLPWKWRGKRKR